MAIRCMDVRAGKEGVRINGARRSSRKAELCMGHRLCLGWPVGGKKKNGMGVAARLQDWDGAMEIERLGSSERMAGCVRGGRWSEMYKGASCPGG